MTSRLVPLSLLVLAAAALAPAAEYRAAAADDVIRISGSLKPGDTVILSDGTWQDQNVVFYAQGTEQQPITFRAATSGKVTLTGKSSVTVDGEWVVVSGLLLKECTAPGEGVSVRGRNNRITDSAIVASTFKHYLRMFGTRNRVDHCYFADKTNGDPTFQVEVESQPNNHRVDHNHFGPRPPLGRNGGETIRIGYSWQSMQNSRTLVEANFFDRCDGEIEIISSKSCENVYRGNTFLNCAGMLTLRHGNRCIVDGNFFLGEGKRGSGGIRVIGDDHVITNNYVADVQQGAFWITAGVPNPQLVQYFRARGCVVAFNTVVNSRGPCVHLNAGMGSSGRTLPPQDIAIANNLFSVPADGSLLLGTEGENFKWAGNFVAAPFVGAEHHGLSFGNPKLVKGADGLWRPAADSPVRGAAKGEWPSVKSDIDGQPRTGRLDIGCDQLSDGSVINRPLTAADVGPSWLAR